MRGDEFFTQMAGREPFSRLHPKVAAFFKDYLADEKIVRFGEQYVLNTHFPPWPSAAFDRLAEQFAALGEAGAQRRLFSVTWGVTNRCNYRCWHCYNAGRSQDDLPLEIAQDVATQLQELGAVVVTLTGGEPLLRHDLGQIAGAFDRRTSLVLGTTGDGLTVERAQNLRAAGIFAVGISLDSAEQAEHDRLRGREGAFPTALEALRAAGDAGLYPYIVSVATREFLQRERFMSFLGFARDVGALEVHLLEPSATGRLAGRTDVVLSAAERRQILDYQREVARREDLPILSSLTYLESGGVFGCGAGLTHLYIDGSGEVCPCNLVPLSFGNVRQEPLGEILDRMGAHFQQPRCTCAGRLLCSKITSDRLPAEPSASAELCRRHLPEKHDLPRLFRVRLEATERVGTKELRDSYDQVHEDYDSFWLVEAGRPVDELVDRLHLVGGERIFEAGCGTGYATTRLAERAGDSGSILAVDLSEGMLTEARRRLGGRPGVRFLADDALAVLQVERPFDLVFSSWVLGYIALKPFFAAGATALSSGGRLAFVVHKQDSPRRETDLFRHLAAEDPTMVTRHVYFDFPRDAKQVRAEMAEVGLEIEDLREGAVTFEYGDAGMALEHLLKSGAGTAFYDAVDAARREQFERQFVDRLAEQCRGGPCHVVHDFVACIAKKP